jgi:hypothetical protein
VAPTLHLLSELVSKVEKDTTPVTELDCFPDVNMTIFEPRCPVPILQTTLVSDSQSDTSHLLNPERIFEVCALDPTPIPCKVIYVEPVAAALLNQTELSPIAFDHNSETEPSIVLIVILTLLEAEFPSPFRQRTAESDTHSVLSH